MSLLRIASVATAALLASSAASGAQDWEFQITPYAWLAGLTGDVGTTPGLPAGSVNLSFGDILEDLDFAGMLMASARNGPWVVFFDTTYVHTSSTEMLGGVVFDRVGIESETTTFALAAGRTVADTVGGSVDLYLGARGWWLENSFDLRGVGGCISKRTEKADWINPLVGVAGRFQVSDRWRVFGGLEGGGFGVGDGEEWSVLAGATWQVTDRIGASFGWRHLEIDYDEEGVVFDVAQTGPFLGATFRF